MTLADDIKAKARSTFEARWDVRDGRVVPDYTTVKQGNDAVHFERATILYADLDSSTALVDAKQWWFSAEVYKTFLYASSRIIRSEGGVITSYDGDRVMAVFLDDYQSVAAVKAGLKINHAVRSLVQPELTRKYGANTYEIKHVVGIDTSEIHVANAGVRGDVDLTWVGRAANYAAKITALNSSHQTYITNSVYASLDDSTKFGGTPRRSMWGSLTWPDMNNMTIFRSDWWWEF